MRGRLLATWVGIGTVVALAVVVLAVLGNGSAGYAAVGLTDPGAATKVTTYLLRFVADVTGAVAAGSLVYAAFFAASAPSALSADGWAAVWMAGWSAWAWLASAVALVVFDAADSAGVSVLDVLDPAGLVGSLDALYGPKAWLATAVLALVVALGCRGVMRWRPAVALAAVAVAGLLPPLAVGNASAGVAHDFAMNILTYHVIAAALWLGVLAALVLHLRRGTGRPDVAVRRYRRFTLGCWLVLAASGVVAAVVTVPPAQLVGTGYGRTVLAKAAGLVMLGVLAVIVRRRVLRAAESVRGALRLAAAELMFILLTVAVAMGLTQATPPSWFGPPLDAVEVAVGYALPGPPTVVNLLTVWRFDFLLGTACLAAGASGGRPRARRRGSPAACWSWSRPPPDWVPTPRSASAPT